MEAELDWVRLFLQGCWLVEKVTFPPQLLSYYGRWRMDMKSTGGAMRGLVAAEPGFVSMHQIPAM